MASFIGRLLQPLRGGSHEHERLENRELPDEQATVTETVAAVAASEEENDTNGDVETSSASHVGADADATSTTTASSSSSSLTTRDGDIPSRRVAEDESRDEEGTGTDEEGGGGDGNNSDGASDNEGEDEEEDDDVVRFSRSTVSLAELEEERELARRRTSACVLLAVFVLFRLWVEALQNADFVLLLLCLVGTSWTARWIRHNREREEELDRRISAYLENAEPGTTEVDRNDLRMLSFQAQLALAIMESQRQMMQGGFGHPDGASGGSAGLSDEAKEQWERFQYKDCSPSPSASNEKTRVKGGYGSVSQKDGLQEDGPHCSICLGEYENGEQLVRLPCGHIYHEDCVSSWTTNHVRCPLCNCDLESVSTTTGTTQPEESIV